MKSAWTVVSRFGWALTQITFFMRLAGSYLEPGTTSFLLKILVASLTAVVLTIKGVRHMLQRLWHRLTGRKPTKTASPSDKPEENKTPAD